MLVFDLETNVDDLELPSLNQSDDNGDRHPAASIDPEWGDPISAAPARLVENFRAGDSNAQSHAGPAIVADESKPSEADGLPPREQASGHSQPGVAKELEEAERQEGIASVPTIHALEVISPPPQADGDSLPNYAELQLSANVFRVLVEAKRREELAGASAIDTQEATSPSSQNGVGPRAAQPDAKFQAESYRDSTDTARTIFPRHVAALAARGISPETAKRCNIYSEKNPEALARLLNSKVLKSKNLPAIVIPFGDSGLVRVRPDNPRKNKDDKPVKYESPKGSTQHLYFTRGVDVYLQDVKQYFIFTEGEFKAITATQEGFPTIGLVGIWGWKVAKLEKLLGDFNRIKLVGRTVYIAFDSDKARNSEVLAAQNRFAKSLAAAGAIVRIVNIPDGPGEAKQGLDDFIRANWDDRKRQLQNLLDEATAPDPVEEENENASGLDPAPEARLILGEKAKHGVPTLIRHRDSFHRWYRNHYAEVSDGEIRSNVILRLNASYSYLTSAITNNVMDQLKAQAFLSSSIEPHCWIPDRPEFDTKDLIELPFWKPCDVLVLQNGLLHLPTMEFMDPTPRFFTPTALDYSCDPSSSVKPETWLKFLEQLWKNDPASIELMQEWFAYCLTPDTRFQKLLLMLGPPRSGKGTAARVLTGVVGERNIAAPTLASLATNFGLESLLDKSVAIISDARLSGRTDQAVVTERILSITGEDMQTVDRKHRSTVTTKLPTRFTILTNELPALKDSSGALANRFLVLQFVESFLGREDPDLTQKLLAERPAILGWAIEGWKRLRERGRFLEPASASDIRNELGDTASPISAFLRESCNRVPGYVSPAYIFEAWCQWCEPKKIQPGTVNTFGSALRAVCPGLKSPQITQPDGSRPRFYEGITLKEPVFTAVERRLAQPRNSDDEF